MSIAHRGEELWLLPACVDDAEELVLAVNSSLLELRPYLPWAHRAQTVAFQKERLAAIERGYGAGGDQTFHMRLDRGGPIVGCIGLHARTLSSIGTEIGFWVRSSATGRGLATLWSQALTVLCFERYGFDRVQCCHNELNLGSARVIDKVGFKHEGALRRYTRQPSPERVAAGAVSGLLTHMHALCPEDRDELDWYGHVCSALTIYDQDGHPHPAVP